MKRFLTSVEVRALGCLIEKEITTPDYYPISLNALVNACNQKSNRDPVMSLDEGAVREALRCLNEKNVAGEARGTDSRVPKYEHRLSEVFNFNRHESAIICELLLRGPQTPGELRSRAERMYKFDDLGVVHATLHRLMKRDPPLVAVLPRQAGTKEARYAHLLSGEPIQTQAAEMDPSHEKTGMKQEQSATTHEEVDRISLLERAVAALEKEVAQIRQQLADFRKQFD